MKKIVLYANDLSSLAGVTGAQEIFNCANIIWGIENPGTDPIFECSVVSPEKSCQELCAGLNIEFATGLDHHEHADAVISTGFLYRDINQLIQKIDKSKAALNWLRRHYGEGTTIGASCSGTVLLAETGLLDEKRATTSWWLDGFFRTRYPRIELHIDRLLVDNGHLVTAGAMTSYIYLVLGLIERFYDKKLALSCAKVMLIDLNKNYQTPYAILQTIVRHPDDIVLKAQYWMNEHVHDTIDMHELADYLAVSYRTLLRRFKTATGDTPICYLQKARVEMAKHLLETTALNTETVMERVGYSDLSSFTLLFKRLTRLTPREYRDNFSIAYRKKDNLYSERPVD
jgi:transcriptional regulator GlxA family with amidase domain